MREYGYLEFMCNNTDHVAGNESTFQIMCPPNGTFPTIYEYPVMGPNGTYSDTVPDIVLDDTKKIVNKEC